MAYERRRRGQNALRSTSMLNVLMSKKNDVAVHRDD
jgi:hypothetical protein